MHPCDILNIYRAKEIDAMLGITVHINPDFSDGAMLKIESERDQRRIDDQAQRTEMLRKKRIRYEDEAKAGAIQEIAQAELDLTFGETAGLFTSQAIRKKRRAIEDLVVEEVPLITVR